MSDRRVLLVDGTGVLYRAFFAIRNLSTRDGRPTNAVFGFIRMLRQLAHVWRPTHWAVALDGGTPAARLALLATYKAQRPPMPSGLREQFPALEEYLEQATIPALRLEGEEADDVLATIAQRSQEAGAEVLIASSDKDLYQMVNERVQLVAPSKESARFGRQQVFDKTGVFPEQIVEWLALAGDSVDNIPGVAGLGPKTAARLLSTFGSLAGIWERIDEVEPVRIRAQLLACRPQVETNVALVRLRTDVPCALAWEAMEVRPEDPRRLRPYFEKMEFHSMADALGEQRLL
jgi:DNA polymerase I